MIKILVDSASDIEEHEAQAMGITMLPVEVRFGDETYLDGVDLSHRRFFEKLIESNELPKTSQINEYRWSEAFQKLTKNGDAVIAITLSSKLSGTYTCAKNAAKRFSNVYVVDSLSATTGERLLCQYALNLIDRGMDIEAVVNELNEKKKKICILAVVGTLKYLRMGGRISGAAALAGSMLSVKPVIAVEKGEVKLVGKAIGSKKGNNLLMQLMQKCGGIDFTMPYGLMYSGLGDEFLKKYLQDSSAIWEKHIADPAEIPVYLIGSAIGTHIGPNAIGVAFFSN